MAEILFSFTALNSAGYIVALALIVRAFHGKPPLFAMGLWFGHAAILWNAMLIARIFFGYVGPSAFFSLWASAVFLHGCLAIIFHFAAKRLAEKRNGRDLTANGYS